MAIIPIQEAEQLTIAALQAAGASAAGAQAAARALIYAEKQGTASHGLSRVAQCSGHLRSGRIDGQAEARIAKQFGATTIVDANDGLSYPACELAIATLIAEARKHGVAVVAVTNSYHFGVAIYHLERVAAAGMVGLAFSNSPAAMNAWGGKRALFGTNPIAAMFPRRAAHPLAIDLALSEVARGKLMVAAKEGKTIPPGWALDEDGNPTTDPARGLKGSMAPMGGVKGAMLALTVELLVTAFTGARLGFETDSFFEAQGNRPRIGHLFLAIDPAAMGGSDLFAERVETLVAAMVADDEVRLPGARRYALAEKAEREGLNVADATLAQLRQLAGA